MKPSERICIAASAILQEIAPEPQRLGLSSAVAFRMRREALRQQRDLETWLNHRAMKRGARMTEHRFDLDATKREERKQ